MQIAVAQGRQADGSCHGFGPLPAAVGLEALESGRLTFGFEPIDLDSITVKRHRSVELPRDQTNCYHCLQVSGFPVARPG
jgi:hypothetical protein